MHKRDSGQGNKKTSTWTQGDNFGKPREILQGTTVNWVRTLSAYKHEIAGSTIWPQVHLHLKMGGY
jgi:hypothetical protein